MVSLRSRTAKAASQKKGTNSETSDKTANGSGGVTNINNGSKSNTNGVVEVEKQLPPTLSRRGLILARIGIVLCVIGMIVAAIGVAAIATPDSMLAKSSAGVLAYKVLSINPMIFPFVLNGCFIGSVYCYIRMRDHKKATEMKGKMKKEDE